MVHRMASSSSPFIQGGAGGLTACWIPVSSLPMVSEAKGSPFSELAYSSLALQEDSQEQSIPAVEDDNVPTGRGGVAAFACLGFSREGWEQGSSFCYGKSGHTHQTRQIPAVPLRSAIRRNDGQNEPRAAGPAPKAESSSFVRSHPQDGSRHEKHRPRSREGVWGILVGGASRHAASNEVFLWHVSSLELSGFADLPPLPALQSRGHSSSAREVPATVQGRGDIRMHWLRLHSAEKSRVSAGTHPLAGGEANSRDPRESGWHGPSRGGHQEQASGVQKKPSKVAKTEGVSNGKSRFAFGQDRETLRAVSNIPAISGSACFSGFLSSDCHTEGSSIEETEVLAFLPEEEETKGQTSEAAEGVLLPRPECPVASPRGPSDGNREANQGLCRETAVGARGDAGDRARGGRAADRDKREEVAREGELLNLETSASGEGQEHGREEVAVGRKVWFHGGQNFFTNEVFDDVFSVELTPGAESAGDEEGGGGSELPSLRVRRLSLPGKNSGSPASADLGHGAVPSHTAESLSSPRPPVSTRLPSTPETDESFLHTDISSFFCSLSAEVNGTSVCVSSSTAEGDVTQYGETSCSSPPVSSPTAANPLQNPSLVLTTPPNRSGVPPAFPCSSAAQNCERSDVSKPACPGPLPLSKSASPSSFSREDLSFGHGRCRPPTLSSHAVAPVLWSPLCGGKSCNDETNEKEELFLFFGGGRGCQTFCDVWLFSPMYNHWVSSSSFLGPELLTAKTLPSTSRLSEGDTTAVPGLLSLTRDEGVLSGGSSRKETERICSLWNTKPCARELTSLSPLPPRLPSPVLGSTSADSHGSCRVARFVLLGGRNESGVFDDIWALYLIRRPVAGRRVVQGEHSEEGQGDGETMGELEDLERTDDRSGRHSGERDCGLTVSRGKDQGSPPRLEQGKKELAEKEPQRPGKKALSGLTTTASIKTACILGSSYFSTVWRRCGQLPSPVCCHNAHLLPTSSAEDLPQILLFGGADATFAPTNQLQVVTFRSGAQTEVSSPHEESPAVTGPGGSPGATTEKGEKEQKKTKQASKEGKLPFSGSTLHQTTETLFPVLIPTFTFISVAFGPCPRFAAASLFLPPDAFCRGPRGIAYPWSNKNSSADVKEEMVDGNPRRCVQGHGATTPSEIHWNQESNAEMEHGERRITEVGSMLLFGGVTQGVDLNDVWLLRLRRSY